MVEGDTQGRGNQFSKLCVLQLRSMFNIQGYPTVIDSQVEERVYKMFFKGQRSQTKQRKSMRKKNGGKKKIVATSCKNM